MGRSAATGAGDVHFEPFVHLVDVDDDQALIAWGGFWFRPFEDGHGWRVLDDEQLGEVAPGRNESIGARSTPYGDAEVRLFDADDRLVTTARTDEANHVWVHGLEPATEYRYEVLVDGRPWVPEECMRWHRLDAERGELRPAGRTYDCRFRTFPRPGDRTTLRFAAIGDYGVGIQSTDSLGDHQRRLGQVLERLVDQAPGLDLVLTLGDNVYLLEGESVGGSGKEDDDWYFSYYEPYRFLISRVPVYPTVGNHDGAETEASDDRAQLADNLFTDLRFDASVEADRDSVTPTESDAPGLFYRFSFGDLVEFVCVDTSQPGRDEHDRFFDHPDHRRFLDEAFDPERPDRRRWLVPFSHHPVHCAGPHHESDADQIRALLPRYRAAGVQLALAGHEHNFQHAVDGGLHQVISGAGGKLDENVPMRTAEAHTRSWASQTHVLLVDVDHDRTALLPVTDLDDDGEPVPVDLQVVDGQHDELPIVIEHPG